MIDRLCFLIHEEQGDRGRKNLEAKKRCSGDTNGWLTKTNKHMSDREGGQGCLEAGPAGCPSFLPIPEVPSGTLLGEGAALLLCQARSPLPQPGLLCLIPRAVPAAGPGRGGRLPTPFWPCPRPIRLSFSLSESSLEHVHVHICIKSPRGASPVPDPLAVTSPQPPACLSLVSFFPSFPLPLCSQSGLPAGQI